MNEKEATKTKFGHDSAARKSLFERAILAGWAPFSARGLIFCGAWDLGVKFELGRDFRA
ncbi:hypothetical protein [uncultured Campylobacter sp.]|uniref:hypothetical protein n=1 Tax=uncultured Campylobacter sp. TaxID=218934 RepID=UPI0025CF2230|nr:hypothetical protein [uncultured Campylobacter sp.]